MHNHNSNNNNNNLNNNGNNNGPLTATMSETSDDSSLNSVELDPMGKRQISKYCIYCSLCVDVCMRSYCRCCGND